MKRKAELMRERYGVGEGTCRDCYHLLRCEHGSRAYFKCNCYGDTCSEATDWRQKEPACGQKNRPYREDKPVMVLVGKGVLDEEIEGQMSLF